MVRRLGLLALLFVLVWPQFSWAKGGPQTHTVYAGQTLGKIAKRYNISVEALCNANGIGRRKPIKPGQILLVPARSDKDGREALSQRKQGNFIKHGLPPQTANPKKKTLRAKPPPKPPAAETQRSTPAESWRKFKRPARRAGYVTLEATGRRWSGYAIVKGNKISGNGRRGFQHALYSWRTGAEKPVDSRLIRLLTQVSDTFGGRPLKIASGYREKSFARESKHKSGQACDFSVEGVPNEALRDYLHTLGHIGVGYYPHSSFVHVDVRKHRTRWVDFSKPGHRPRYRHKALSASKKVTKRPTVEALSSGATDP